MSDVGARSMGTAAAVASSVAKPRARNLYEFLRRRAETTPDSFALHQPVGSRSRRTYQDLTWKQYLQSVEEIAAGLHALGIGRGDIVALESETRAEFYLCDFAVMSCGASSAALYTASPPKEKLRAIERCQPKALICDSPIGYARLRKVALETYILMTGEADGAVSLEELKALGRRKLAEDDALIGRLAADIKPDDPAIVYLTSGATGDSKMVVVQHGAILANVESILRAIHIAPSDSAFAFLPSAHIAQRLVMQIFPVAVGAPIWFAHDLNTVAEEIRAVQPTALLAPPQVWEKIRDRVLESVRRERPWKQRAFRFAMEMGIEASRRAQKGGTPTFRQRLLHPLMDRLVYANVRERLGGRLRLAISGAAPLAEELAHFWAAMGVTITEGYGITEGGIVTLNKTGAERFGCVGQPLPDVEVRLGDDSELEIRSPFSFTEYFGDSEATREVLRDGWLRTGDVAKIDSEDRVYITGRKKEILLSPTGKNIFPNAIEAAFRSEPLINNAVVVGDNQPYLAALLTLNPTTARSLSGMESFRDQSGAALAEAPPVVQSVEAIVRRVNRSLAPVEQVRRFRILPRDFSIEKGEITPTLKLRRNAIAAAFRDEIAALFSAPDSGPHQAKQG